MATSHLAISVIDLRALRRIYCHGVPQSWYREGHLKKLEWYIFTVIASLATMSRLSFAGAASFERLPHFLWHQDLDYWVTGLEEQELKLNEGSKHRGANKENLKAPTGRRGRQVERIGVGLQSLEISERTVCKRVLSRLLERLYRKLHCLGNRSESVGPVQNSQVCSQ